MIEFPVVDVTIPQNAFKLGCETTNSCYVPFEITVDAGTKVRWTNTDTAFHTVTSGNPSDGVDGKFDGILFADKTFTISFEETGTFGYYCLPHPWMKGRVIVQ